jgi:hypothetical protein
LAQLFKHLALDIARACSAALNLPIAWKSRLELRRVRGMKPFAGMPGA